MAFLFKRGKKTPPELVTSTQNHIKVIVNDKTDEKTAKKSLEKISKNLSEMKLMLYGNEENEAKPENIKKLCDELLKSPVLLEMLQYMKKFEFEARKDVAQIYNFILRNRKTEATDYIRSSPSIIRILVHAYNDSDIALNCGSILREVVRQESLNEVILNSHDLFDPFFDYIQLSTFDIASDAFLTFKMMITKHKAQCARFLEVHYERVFSKYKLLLTSKNYVTKRQSLKLLGEILLNRANFSVMIKYINSAENLKIIMNLLRVTSKNIQIEAFHVFKIFVANPKKEQPVLEILLLNKRKLIDFLTKFQDDKQGKDTDETFNEEKKLLLSTLQELNGAALGIDESKLMAVPSSFSHRQSDASALLGGQAGQSFMGGSVPSGAGFLGSSVPPPPPPLDDVPPPPPL